MSRPAALEVQRTEYVTASDGFERLFGAEYARVVAIALRVLGDADEAEDVAQEVFVSFHRRHSPDASYAAAWLHAAAAHTALNYLRGNRRRTRREETEAAGAIRLRDGAEAEHDPQRALEERERRAELRAALAQLPARSAAILALRYSGLSYAEIAAALDVRANGVGTLLRRAEEALRREYFGATSR